MYEDMTIEDLKKKCTNDGYKLVKEELDRKISHFYEKQKKNPNSQYVRSKKVRRPFKISLGWFIGYWDYKPSSVYKDKTQLMTYDSSCEYLADGFRSYFMSLSFDVYTWRFQLKISQTRAYDSNAIDDEHEDICNIEDYGYEKLKAELKKYISLTPKMEGLIYLYQSLCEIKQLVEKLQHK